MRFSFLRLSLLVAAIGASVASQALTFTFSNPDQVVVRPTSGTTTISFFGTITATEPGEGVQSIGLTDAYTINGDLLNSYDLTSVNPIAADASVRATGSFTGLIFSMLISSDQPLGYYYLGPFLTGRAGSTIDSSLGIDYEATDTYSVRIQAVPEPASIAALGLGALTLVRRRRKA